MSLFRKGLRGILIIISLFSLTSGRVQGEEKKAKWTREPSQIALKCIQCHQEKSPGIVNDWKNSSHSKAKVDCLECHKADPQEPDSREHEGASISALVSPNDCQRCHPKEVKEFNDSLHSKGATFVQPLDKERGKDDFLAYVVEGKAAAVMGCEKCHGSIVTFNQGAPDPTTWPNTGIGRINPDGSRGSCSACHTRHRFSLAEARKPEACGQCHIGPDHPQLEIYLESKHGAIYQHEGREWDWDVATPYWDTRHYRAPTCATCHMSGVGVLESTHNVSSRLSWELERPLAVKTENWQEKRAKMQKICLSCHSAGWVKGFYQQFDAAVELYNTKYFIPMQAMMNELYAQGLLTSDNKFDEEIEWVFFELWHHEGRRARMGAAMMGPDYVQWHGFYDLAKGLVKMKKLAQELKVRSINRQGNPLVPK